jgi:outer membrane protein assembly factor BamB
MGELADLPAMEAVVKEIPLPRADVQSAGEFVLLARKGPLPGAADWSHPAANAACTGASRDEFIRPPMSILWYDAAQRWHKFPGQNLVRVAKGRLVLLKEGRLRASDVYTGRTLWQIDVPVGEPPLSDNQSFEEIRYERHRVWGPKPSLDGKTQMVLLDDTIYLSNGTKLLRFDAATGRAIGTIELPEDFDQPWLNLRVARDYLVGTSGPHIVCLHRRTGDLLWRVATDRSELSLAVGAEKVFCAELVNPRHGDDASDGSLFALDLATGKEQWRRSGGAPLRYSPSQDLVVTPTTFYHARDGEPLSMPEKGKERKYVITGGGLPKTGLPGYLAGDKLLAGNEQTLQIYALPSGEQLGETFHWVRRGCTGTRASMHLLTTRYRGNSAWVDLKNGQITPFLGIRPGCQRNNNLYPANGVLNIPNITAGCTCNYTPASTACVSRAIVEQPQEK